MTEVGLSWDMFTAAIAVWLTGLIISFRFLKPGPALLCTTLKVLFPVVFFTWFDYGQFRFFDDIHYFSKALILKHSGITPLDSLLGLSPVPLTKKIGGDHTLYYWWNLFAFQLFGVHYWSAIFLNIFLTFVACLNLIDLLKGYGFSERFRVGFAVFFLLHWDIITWSSLVNLKDTLVLTLSSICILSIDKMLARFSASSQESNLTENIRKPSLLWLIPLIIALILLLQIRHYLPPLIILAVTVYCLAKLPLRKAIPLGLIGIIGIALLKPWESKSLSLLNFSGLPFKSIRFILMPYFWTVDYDYRFTEPAQFLHWIFFPFAVIGAIRLWQAVPRSRFLTLFFFAVVLFYAAVPQLQGTRQRFQLTIIIALFQFNGVVSLLTHKERQRQLQDSVPRYAATLRDSRAPQLVHHRP